MPCVSIRSERGVMHVDLAVARSPPPPQLYSITVELAVVADHLGCAALAAMLEPGERGDIGDALAHAAPWRRAAPLISHRPG